VHDAGGQGERERGLRLDRAVVDAHPRRPVDQQQQLEQAVVPVFGDLPGVAFAAAANVLDMDEFRRDGVRLAVERKYRDWRLAGAAATPRWVFRIVCCSAHSQRPLSIQIARKVQKFVAVVHFVAGAGPASSAA